MEFTQKDMLLPLDIQMFAGKVAYGLNKVHYSVITRDVDGTVTYAPPVPLPGAVSMAITPTGDATNFYADNGIYFAINSNTGYEGTLAIATIPDKFKIDVLGEVLDTNGLLVEYSNAKQNDIALMFQIDGDVDYTRFVYYDVTVARPGVNGATTAETIEITPDELTITIKPRQGDYAVKAISDPPAVADPTGPYAKFFEKVQEPTAPPAP